MSVDRTHRIGTSGFAEANPRRVVVARFFTHIRRQGLRAYWGVWCGGKYLGAEPDFATAITYADSTARKEAQ